MEVPIVRTLATAADVIRAFLATFPGLSETGARIMAAQSAVETAHWRAMYNWNTGNITADRPDSQTWFQYASLPGKFRAYESLGAGATAMGDWIRSHGVADAVQRADLDAYKAGLKRACYLGCVGRTDQRGVAITDQTYDVYVRSIASLAAGYGRVMSPPVIPAATIARQLPGPPSAVAAGLGGVLLALAIYGAHKSGAFR